MEPMRICVRQLNVGVTWRRWAGACRASEGLVAREGLKRDSDSGGVRGSGQGLGGS